MRAVWSPADRTAATLVTYRSMPIASDRAGRVIGPVGSVNYQRGQPCTEKF
jgi:hypothetical protein